MPELTSGDDDEHKQPTAIDFNLTSISLSSCEMNRNAAIVNILNNDVNYKASTITPAKILHFENSQLVIQQQNNDSAVAGKKNKHQKSMFDGIFGCIKPFFNFWPHVDSSISSSSSVHQTTVRPESMQQHIFDLNNDGSTNDDECEIPYEDLEGWECVGSGAQGCVFRSTLKGEVVAVKKLKTKEEANIKHLRRLNHENLVKYRGHSIDNTKVFCIIMDFCPYGNLHSYINPLHEIDRKNIEPRKMMNWARQIAQGMNYLHVNKIVHRDLKSPNILIDKDDVIKITDFGASKYFNEKSEVMSFTGTISWMAPEVIRHQTCSEKVDVWSFGVVLWELLLCEAPYLNLFETSKLIFGVGSGTLTLHLPQSLPAGLKILLKQCLNYKPRNRPTFSQILKHLDVAMEQDVCLLTNDTLYLKLQKDKWKTEVRKHYESLTNQIDRAHNQQNNQSESELQRRRDEELKHACDIKEEYEKKLLNVNNLYFELSAVLVQLDQREKEILKKEKLLNIKNSSSNKRIVKTLIKKEFQQKASKVFTKLNNKKKQEESPAPAAAEIVCEMAPIRNSNSQISLDQKTNTTSNEAPMSYEQVMMNKSPNSNRQKTYHKKQQRKFKTMISMATTPTATNGQQQPTAVLAYQRRRTTNLCLAQQQHDDDDKGFHADTEDDDIKEKHKNKPPAYTEYLYRRYKMLNNSKGAIVGADSHDYDIDNDNIEDDVCKVNCDRPISAASLLDDETRPEQEQDEASATTTNVIVNDLATAESDHDDHQYDYEYDQKIEHQREQQQQQQQQHHTIIYDYFEHNEILEVTRV